MARDIKDKLNLAQDGAPIQEEPKTPSSSIQIPVTPALEDTLVNLVLEDLESSKTSRANRNYGTTSKGEKLDFEKWFKSIQDLYSGKREPKTEPWKFCSNRSLRISAAILDMLHARLYSSVVNEELLRFRAGDLTDEPKVLRISKLMHWWIWVHCRMRTFFDIWVKAIIGYGDVITESSWQIDYRHRGMRAKPIIDETGQPLTNPDGTPAQIEEPWIDQEESSFSKLYLRDRYFLQDGSRNIQQEPVILENSLLYRELEQGELEGRFINISTKLKDKLTIPKIESRPGMTPDEEEALKAVKRRNQTVTVLTWYGKYDQDGDGFPEDIRIMISPDHKIYLSGVKLFDITYSGKRPLVFTKFDSKFDRLEENEGEGIIEKVKELAEEIDAIFNQLTDSNTLSILRPGFYDSSGDIDAPVLKLAPNRIIPVSDPQRSIFFPEFRIATDQLINAIRMVLEFIERLTAASSYVLGKESEIVGGSGTATRTNAIVQSAEQRFALPSERLREGASFLINKHLDLLQKNLPPNLETRILGDDGKPVFGEAELQLEGISGEYDAYLLSDPSMGSKAQERELASMFYSVLLQNVLVGTDPVKIYKITADFLRAYDKEPEKYLGPEPDEDMIDQPEDENTLILQGDFSRVRAQIAENHVQHIKVHQDLLQSPSLAELAPHLQQEVVQMTEQHIAEHTMMMQTMMSMIQSFGGKGGQSAGRTKGSKGAPRASGLEQIQGPLGEALNSKRAGEIQGPETASIP